jgi:predicted regulator of Ras-like GTPase activity (Roadblock/LC7/MglB family)
MDAAKALGELRELSSQITAAVVLGADGAVLAGDEELAATTGELAAAAADLGGPGADVTRVEVELGEGAVFLVREGKYTVAATTGPDPTSGLVVYDLRTCAKAISEAAPKRRTRKPKEPKEPSE